MVGPADGHGQGIGRVMAGRGGKLQQHPDHLLHLLFRRLTIAGHRLFYYTGTVFLQKQAMLPGGQDEHPTGMAQL